MPQSCFLNAGKSGDDFLKDRLVHESRQSLHQIPINEVQFEIDQTVKSYFSSDYGSVFWIEGLIAPPSDHHFFLYRMTKILNRLGSFGYMARKMIMYSTAIIKCQNFESHFPFQLWV